VKIIKVIEMKQNLETCPTTTPLIIILVILVVMLIGLSIWIFFILQNQHATIFENNMPPVYVNGVTGALTPNHGELELTGTRSANQEWNILSVEDGDVLLRHRSTGDYISNPSGHELRLTQNRADAAKFKLTSNEQICHFVTNGKYLAFAEDQTVGVMNVRGEIPSNTEWRITLGS